MSRTAFVAIAIILSACASHILNPASRSPSQAQVRNYPPDVFESGFVNLDVLTPHRYSMRDRNKVINPVMTAEDIEKARDLKLAEFEPHYDFNSLQKSQDSKEPWLGRGLDVRRERDAEMLVKLLQRYIYEGWFEKDSSDKKTNYDSHFRENDVRTWCHTPWMTMTDKGREAIHGLTKEFPLSSSAAFKVPEEIDGLAYTWVLSFYNRVACETYDQLFRPREDNIHQDAEAKIAEKIRNRTLSAKSKDGTVDFKLLFSAMDDWRVNMKGQWDDAYNWYAHVSTDRKIAPGSPEVDQSRRKIMNIPLVQIDVGFKDSRIAGLQKELNYWGMTTFYYDPTYRGNELVNDMAIPEPLKHMRPAGFQYGLEVGQSHVFPGAKNNHRPEPEGVELPYSATRLNGPIDSPQASCLGCHAQSGISFGLKPDSNGEAVFSPWFGFLTLADYKHYLAPEMGTGVSLDFNMQLDEAMKYFAAAKTHRIFPPSRK